MAVNGVNNTTATTPTAVDNSSRTRLAQNFEMFLTLLTTQMKNQDPLSPMDSTQFTQQIVQMTGVEQQLQTNDLLKQLVSNTASGIQASVALIGKDVRAATDTAALTNGKAEWIYKLDAAASDVKIEILDSKGNVVATKAGDKTAGEHTFTWNGKTAAGSTAPDGQYSLRITAKGTDGKNLATSTYVQGVVSGVEQSDGKTLLTINGGKVDWTKVTTIKTPPATTNTGGITPPPTETDGGSTTDPTDPTNPDDETSPPAQA